MSEQRGNPKDSGQPAARKNRRRSRWFLTGGLVAGSLVAGAAGLTGVLALGGPEGTKNLGLPNLPDVFNSARPAGDEEGGQGQKNKHADNQGDERRDGEGSRENGEDSRSGGWNGGNGSNGGEWNGKGKGKGPRQGDEEAIAVRCNSNDLIAAIVRANAGDGGTLKLAERCTYTLTANQGGSGLPTIVQSITIKGNDSTIVRAANATAAFRIFTVGSGGHLTLVKTAVEGGSDTTANGGGGMLVQTGGSAEVIDSTFKRNTTVSSGGAIANQGTTTLTKTAIANNSAAVSGGGIFTTRGGLVVEDSWLTSNSTGGNGGGLTSNGGVVTVSKTEIIHNNAASGSGGGVYNAAGATSTIVQSNVANNTSGIGGGLANVNATSTLRDSKVSRNTATTNGGGVLNSGTFVAEKSVVGANTTRGNGGGINSTGGSVVLRDSQIEYNNAIGTASQGGGIFNQKSALSLTQTSVTENNSNTPHGGIWTNVAPTVDQRSAITKNRSTNCGGGAVAVPNCFG